MACDQRREEPQHSVSRCLATCCSRGHRTDATLPCSKLGQVGARAAERQAVGVVVQDLVVSSLPDQPCRRPLRWGAAGLPLGDGDADPAAPGPALARCTAGGSGPRGRAKRSATRKARAFQAAIQGRGMLTPSRCVATGPMLAGPAGGRKACPPPQVSGLAWGSRALPCQGRRVVPTMRRAARAD
jgi:hypothetical protein